MRLLASALNRHCPRRCKVLLTAMDLLCFNLSVLAEYAYNVHLYNVVGVTGHLGMETLPAISRVKYVLVRSGHVRDGLLGQKSLDSWSPGRAYVSTFPYTIRCIA